MKTWPKIIIRTIALTNVVLGAFGLFLQIDSVIRFHQRYHFSAATPYEAKAYWTMASVSFVFASITLLSGFLLWRTDRRALQLCTSLFASELVYWVGQAILEFVLVTSKNDQAHLYAMSMAGATGIGSMGIAPQIVSFYPVWVLVLINAAYWRLEKASPLIR